MIKYGITQLARFFKISKESIRKYEAKGLLQSERNKDNQYREYDVWDFNALAYIRQYVKLGFSMQEAARLLHHHDNLHIAEGFDAHISKMEEEIARQQRNLFVLKRWKAALMEYEAHKAVFRIETLPAVKMSPYLEPFSLSVDSSALSAASEWTKEIPYTFMGLRINHETLSFDAAVKEKDLPFQCGFSIWEEDATAFSLEHLPFSHKIEGHLCATGYYSVSYTQHLTSATFMELYDFIRDEGYVVCGDIFVQIMHMGKAEEEYVVVDKVWIPIEKMKL